MEKLSVLLYSCSTHSYLSEGVVRELNLKVHPSSKGISIAQKTLNIYNSRGDVVVNLTLCLNDQLYVVTCLGVLKDLCSDLILGQDLCQHQGAKFKTGGSQFELATVQTANWTVLVNSVHLMRQK